MINSIGIFFNIKTYDEYEIFEKTEKTIEPSNPKVKVLPIKSFITASDKKVIPLNEKLTRFKLQNEILAKKTVK